MIATEQYSVLEVPKLISDAKPIQQIEWHFLVLFEVVDNVRNVCKVIREQNANQ